MLHQSKFKWYLTACFSILLTELKFLTEIVCLNAAVCEMAGWESESNYGHY